jgi:hypothetical protein
MIGTKPERLVLAVAVFLWIIAPLSGFAGFRFSAITDKSLQLSEGNRPVLVYNHGLISKEEVPADRNRSSYIHPLYGLDGEVLTDDFPLDHFHHRGLFWAWPHVKIGDEEVDLWMLNGIRHGFERWLTQKATADSAVLGVQNGWFIEDRKVVDEQVWLRVLPATSEGQAIDIELVWIPVEKPLTLRGAEGKSYGGLTLRFAPRQETIITTPDGISKKDLQVTQLPWADLSARFPGTGKSSGAAIFIHPQHPDYPPEWLTRHYGVLCLGWPGVNARSFVPGETIRCRYRVWLHRQTLDSTRLNAVYGEYKKQNSIPLSSQTCVAEQKADRISVNIDGKLFTEYLFRDDEKYPYFFPVNGPRSDKTVTERRLESYPHHSSIFFGCDKVNGGNYWQEGLERGRIVSKQVKLLRSGGHDVVFEQVCRWERVGAESPFDDVRRIRISAPSPDLRCIDVSIKFTARIKVRIDKTNHSLFSVRMAPDLNAQNGGRLINASGEENEKGTFGKPSPWGDFRGARNGEVEGVTLMSHPDNRWSPVRWFTRDYGFMSPTPFYWPENDSYIEFQPGESVELRYRVLIHAGDPSRSEIQAAFEQWSREAEKMWGSGF